MDYANGESDMCNEKTLKDYILCIGIGNTIYIPDDLTDFKKEKDEK